jgi:threonine synthase
VIAANRNGHIACTHGGESLAGLLAARDRGVIDSQDIVVLDSTAHAIKFAGFQEMYFEQTFPEEYSVSPKADLINAPHFVHPADLEHVPAPGKPLKGEAFERFVSRTAEEIAAQLKLEKFTES